MSFYSVLTEVVKRLRYIWTIINLFTFKF